MTLLLEVDRAKLQCNLYGLMLCDLKADEQIKRTCVCVCVNIQSQGSEVGLLGHIQLVVYFCTVWGDAAMPTYELSIVALSLQGQI